MENINELPAKCDELLNNSNGSDSDSSNWGLEIIVKSPRKKRKKKDIDPKDKEMIEKYGMDIEETLEEKASKANLSHATVKSILKHIFTHEYVLALVKQYENSDNPANSLPFEPKITRSKAKELYSNSETVVIETPWPTSEKKSEVQALLGQDLKEDSSGDEYVPGEDDSEDDISTIGTLSTPPTPKSVAEASNQFEDDSVFKSPLSADNKNQSDEANIAHRTRSKFSLSTTPLEQIEQAFMPPDITTDMYELDCNDDDWNEFLKSFTQPLEEVVKTTEDEDHDPEYNVLLDEEINKLDKEELRSDKAVKVPRRELNDLMTELFDYVDICSRESDKEFLESSVEINQQVIDSCIEIFNATTLLPVDICHKSITTVDIPILQNVEESNTADTTYTFSSPQLLLLGQQLRQHVQILVQNFILTYDYTNYNSIADNMREYLLNLKFLADRKEISIFKCVDLKNALTLVKQWETNFKDNNPEGIETKEYYDKVMKESIEAYKNEKTVFLPFPPLVLKTISESDVFLYPKLLPHIPFKHPQLLKNDRTPFSFSEYQLVALGLEQFVPHLKNNKEFTTRRKSMNFRLLAELISSVMMPSRESNQIYWQIIEKRRKKYFPNPISYYHINKKAPVSVHRVLKNITPTPPRLQPANLLPRQWKNYIWPCSTNNTIEDSKSNSPGEKSKNKNLKNSKKVNLKSKLYKKKKINNDKLEIKSFQSTCNIRENEKKHIQNNINETYRKILPKTKLGEDKEINNEELKADCSESPCNIQEKKEVRTMKRKFLGCFRRTISYLKYLSLRKYLNNLDNKTIKEKDEKKNNQQEETEGRKNKSNDKNIEQTSTVNTNTVNKNDDSNTTVSQKQVKEVKKVNNITEKNELYLTKIARISPPDTIEEKDKREAFAHEYFDKLKITLSEDHFKKIESVFKPKNIKLGDAVDLYNKVKLILYPSYQNLANEFLQFLNTEQANAISKLIPFFIINHMLKFTHNLEFYFKDELPQLSRIQKSISNDNDESVTLYQIERVLLPLLKCNPLLCDRLLEIFLKETPSSTLFNGAWEILDPDENRHHDELPSTSSVISNEELCSCSCHKIVEQKQDCLNCGLRFLHGKLYCQTDRGLKRVKIKFPFSINADSNSLNATVQKDSSKKDENPIPTFNEQIENMEITNTTPKTETSKALTENEVKNNNKGKKIETNNKIWGEWTKVEDKIILESFQQNPNNDFMQISAQKLKNRTVQEIENRFEQLMVLLQEMVP